ncbi:MAG: EMC3/TMCO1 family protein [archaeon]
MDLTALITLYPAYSIIILSAVVTLVSSLVTKWMTNQVHLKSLKERQKQVQKDLKKCKPGDKLFEELQSEMLQITMTMMKSSFKPLLVTFIPFLLLLGWIKNTYTVILPGWLWYYIISSIAFSLVYRKVLKMA